MHDYGFYKRAIERSFYIINKDMKATPFLLNPPQDRVLKALAGMDIILKARQEGISSLILAMFAIDFITIENIKCVVISHEDKATQRLFDRVKYFLDSMASTFPGELPYKLKYNSRRELVNTTKNSTFYIGTAGARAFGHGETINNLHVSELSRWPDQERMMIGLLQAVPKDGRIVIESTADGFGDYYYKLWEQNKDKPNPYHTHFLPWFELPDYVYPLTEWPDMQLMDEEKNLMNQYGLKREQIAWRRWKINQMGGDWQDASTWDNFNEQYPSNAEEAFIVSGNPVWSPNLLRWYLTHSAKPMLRGTLRGYQPISIEPNEKGYLKIFREPDEFHTYAIGVDISEGKVMSEGEEGRERDASCAQVLDKTTYEQVAIWHGRIDPDLMGRQLDMLGRYYNDALIGVERNAVGLTPLVVLRDLNYPNLYYREKLGLITEKITAELGWLTTTQSKESLIADATNLLRDRRLTLYDDATIAEMMSFVRDAEGHARAAKSAYDDRCFVAGTKVLTNKGNVPIETVREGDLVMTRKGLQPVIAIGNRYEHVIENKLLNLTGTPDHPIITRDGVVRLDNVKASDIIYTWNEKLSSIEEKSITAIQTQRDGNSGFTIGSMTRPKSLPSLSIGRYGLTTLGQSLKNILSIIKTETRSIMRLPIWHVSPQQIIPAFTSTTQEGSSFEKSENLSQAASSSNFENGNLITLKRQGVFIRKVGENKPSELPSRFGRGGRVIRKKQEGFTNESVLQTLQNIGEKRKVYNLRVANAPEYFANNILVHNCMALLIAIRMLSRAKAVNRANAIEQDDDMLSSGKGFYMGGQSFNAQGMPAHPDEMDGLDSGLEI